MTKLTDYSIFMDTSDSLYIVVTTPVEKERIDSCVLKHLFFEGVKWHEKSPQNPRDAFSDTLRMSRSKFRAQNSLVDQSA